MSYSLPVFPQSVLIGYDPQGSTIMKRREERFLNDGREGIKIPDHVLLSH